MSGGEPKYHPHVAHLYRVWATQLAGKWGKRFGEAKGWINLRLQIALARGCSMCIRRTRIPWRGLGAVDGAAIPQQH